MNPIQQAVEHCGGRQKLAAAAGVSVQAISFWLAGQRTISPEAANKVHAATGGAVSREMLRPDVFGPPRTPEAVEARSE